MPDFTLNVTGMSAYPTQAKFTDVVFQVFWSYQGTDGTFTTSMSGTTDVPAPTKKDFKPYSELTQEEVLGWVREFTDPAVWPDYEQQMTDWLAAQHNPPVVNPPLPWATEPVPEE